METKEFKIWKCSVCGWIYDEKVGDPSEGFSPGTLWEQIPDEWECPECGVGKADFNMIDVTSSN
ncbi:rubredoxin [Leptospira sp. WS39.C2]